MTEFRTKRGRCVIDGDTLRLESSLVGYFRHLREGNRFLFWAIVASFAVIAVYSAVTLVFGDTRAYALGFVAAAAVLGVAYAVNHLRGFTSDDEIRLDSVQRVNPVEGTKGLTRPRFVVVYEADGGTRKRRILMPSKWLSYGEDEFEKAKRVFDELGLLSRSDQGSRSR